MLRKLVPCLSFANVTSMLALFVALGGTSAYAVNEWNGSNIQDETLTGADVKGKAGTATTAAVNGTLTGADISGQPANPAIGQPFVQGSLNGSDISDGSLGAAELASSAVSSAKLANAAVTGSKLAANAVSSANILDNSLIGADIATGSITGGDIADSSITNLDMLNDIITGREIVNDALTGADVSSLTGVDVTNDSLTGADIQESTLAGVKDGDSCGNSGAVLFGRLCAGSDGVDRSLAQVMDFCASIGLRVPSWGEAVLLAKNHDVPGVDGTAYFWTDEITEPDLNAGQYYAMHVNEAGISGASHQFVQYETVCVTTPGLTVPSGLLLTG